MPDVIFTVSTGFLQRMRNAIVRENSALQGQTNTQLNEAARIKVRSLIKQWVVSSEESAAVSAAAQTARQGISQPGDADIA